MDQNVLDIRWKQRFQNLSRIRSQLDAISKRPVAQMSSVEIAGWIHIFSIAFELSWKTLRDYMLAQGESERMDFPRDIIRLGTDKGFITDGYVWIEMLSDRNSLAHEYDEDIAVATVTRIQSAYAKAISDLYVQLERIFLQ